MLVSITIHLSTKKKLSSGYTVSLFDGPNEVTTYWAGGHPADSQAPGESPTRTVRQWALSTAREIFAEHAGRLPKANEIEVELESPDEE